MNRIVRSLLQVGIILALFPSTDISAECIKVGPSCLMDAFLYEPIIILPEEPWKGNVHSTLVEIRTVKINAVPAPTEFESVVTERPGTTSAGVVVIAPVKEWITLEAQAEKLDGRTWTYWVPGNIPPEDIAPPPAVEDAIPPEEEHRGSVVPPPEKPDPEPESNDCPANEYKDCPVEVSYSWNTNEDTSTFDPNKEEKAIIRTKGFKVGEFSFTNITEDPSPRPCCFSGPGYYRKNVPVIIAEARDDKFVGRTSFLNKNPTLPYKETAGCYIETETILFPDSANKGAPEKWYRHAVRYNGVVYVK